MKDELKFSNTIPTEDNLHKMVAKLVVEKANLMQENEKLKNVLNELEKFCIEEISKRKGANVLDPNQVGAYYIKIALETILDKLHELKESDKS